MSVGTLRRPQRGILCPHGEDLIEFFTNSVRPPMAKLGFLDFFVRKWKKDSSYLLLTWMSNNRSVGVKDLCSSSWCSSLSKDMGNACESAGLLGRGLGSEAKTFNPHMLHGCHTRRDANIPPLTIIITKKIRKISLKLWLKHIVMVYRIIHLSTRLSFHLLFIVLIFKGLQGSSCQTQLTFGERQHTEQVFSLAQRDRQTLTLTALIWKSLDCWMKPEHSKETHSGIRRTNNLNRIITAPHCRNLIYQFLS